ncbi:MFS transporter [Cuniculiplasma sp. SKW3]|uniref:MFS transporter n=1 Tax=Cuniculiplasma sp. SKW3 TaxID=3400170 RepID=UPI003FD5AE0F
MSIQAPVIWNIHSEVRESCENKKIWVILAGSSSMFLWGIVLYMSILVYKFVNIPSDLSFLYPVSGALGLLSGNLLIGYISDRIGRKIPFLISIYMASVGIIGAIFSSNYFELTFFIFFANFFLGGDETVLISYLYEEFHAFSRSRYIVAITNMANGGVFFSVFFPTFRKWNKRIFAIFIHYNINVRDHFTA